MSNNYKKSFLFTIKPKGKDIALVEQVVDFGSKNKPFPKDYKNDNWAQRSLNHYSFELLSNHFEVEISESLEMKIDESNKPKFKPSDMIAFGNFIRDNYHGVGAPKLISYNTTKYPHGTIEEIYHIWEKENNNSNKKQTNE